MTLYVISSRVMNQLSKINAEEYIKKEDVPPRLFLVNFLSTRLDPGIQPRVVEQKQNYVSHQCGTIYNAAVLKKGRLQKLILF